jgi:hypothetical protein
MGWRRPGGRHPRRSTVDPGFRSVEELGRRHPSPAQRGDQHRAYPEVAFVAATTGATSLVASVVCRDVRALYR